MIDYTLPILRLELQAAKHTLIQVLDERHGELQKMISDAMDRALPHLQAQIDDQMERAVREAVAAALNDAANEAVEKVSEELAVKLGSKIEDALRKRVCT